MSEKYQIAEQSKWGVEEPETISAIKRIGFNGVVLDVAAGDGRFLRQLLDVADAVVAVDVDEAELEKIKQKFPAEQKLSTQTFDITKNFPFENDSVDGIFCTGTLHLFGEKTLSFVLSEMVRILKPDGKLLVDFATDIVRKDQNGNVVPYQNRGYSAEEARKIFFEALMGFDSRVETATFSESDLDPNEAGYQTISGNFLVVNGTKHKTF
jgi:ubiquinone/menaquinone biosynthesis C-methylase UbiE